MLLKVCNKIELGYISSLYVDEAVCGIREAWMEKTVSQDLEAWWYLRNYKALAVCLIDIHARTMSAVLCKVENDCLERLYTCLKEQSCIPNGQCSLIFDGLMIPEFLDITLSLELLLPLTTEGAVIYFFSRETRKFYTQSVEPTI